VLGTRIKVVSSPQATSGQNRASAATSAFAGWKDIFWRAYQRTQEDRVLAVAAGVVFYMLLALFPALAALVSLYGLFTDPTLINAHLSLLEGVLPASTVGIIREQVTRLSGALWASAFWPASPLLCGAPMRALRLSSTLSTSSTMNRRSGASSGLLSRHSPSPSGALSSSYWLLAR
jgi:hypothetical protein